MKAGQPGVGISSVYEERRYFGFLQTFPLNFEIESVIKQQC